MNGTDVEERPVKKRRFFVEDPVDLQTSSPAVSPRDVEQPIVASSEVRDPVTDHFDNAQALANFDVSLLIAVVGKELEDHVVRLLQKASDNNLERAINIYLDGSWKSYRPPLPTASNGSSSLPSRPCFLHKSSTSSNSSRSRRMPEKRYIGAFGVTGWATKSGLGLLSYGEQARIERTKPSTNKKLGRVGKPVASKRQDIVVRFTNSRGEEVGRLENETAAWVSTLLDQNICFMEGTCVFAPDRIRTSDTIYLQIRCYILNSAFDNSHINKMDPNRAVGLFEAQESSDERDLRNRQTALLRLLDEVKLKPINADEELEKRKREGLLLAAEKAEQKTMEAGTNSPGKAQFEVKDNESLPQDEPEEGEELEQDQLNALYKKAQTFDFDTPEAEPPGTFALNLRKYQKQALHWMVQKETEGAAANEEQSMHPLWDQYLWPTKDFDDKDVPIVEGQENLYINPYAGELTLEFPVQDQNCLGGVLADEMGLGKTIEMLSLIHSHKADTATQTSGAPATVNDLSRMSNNTTRPQWAPVTTLVVAPMSLLQQWANEAERASTPGSMKTLLYYEAGKNVDLRSLCSESNASQAPNVLITSYGTLLSEFGQFMRGAPGSNRGLFSLEYYRVILDEAHSIKNRLSKTAKACYGINARHRWVLTGTPIVNRLEDLFSLVHFLKVEPWSNHSYWKTFITTPFESKDFIKALDVVQTVLQPLVMRRTKDMKTPDGLPLVPLPPRTINVEKIKLSKNEKEIYNLIFTRAKRTFQQREEAGTLLKSYTTIFAQILRLRQSCCHPLLTRKQELVAEEEDAAVTADLAKGLADDMDLDALLAKFTAESEEQDANIFGTNVLKQIQDESGMECPICTEEPMNDQAITACWHSACKQCLLDYVENQREKGQTPKCMTCREVIDPKDIFEVIRHDPVVDLSPVKVRAVPISTIPPSTPRVSLRRLGCNASAKISALVGHIKQLRKENPSVKSVVFSQFTSFLNLIETAFKRDHIKYLRLDGSMAQKQRVSVIENFGTRKSGVVLLISLRAGGVGLNLVAASRVYMMDPWWSFAVEAQAIDRVHRMGQESDVTVTRFIVEDSIEEKMLRIQERKKFIATSLGMMNDDERKLQRIEDIKELLS